MHVLMVTADLFTSGLTTHLLDLARALRRRGHRVDVALTHPRPVGRAFHAYRRELERAGVGLHFPPLGSPGGHGRPSLQADDRLVHVHSPRSLAWGQRVAEAGGAALVVTCHGLGLQQPLYRPALEAAHRLICVGPRIAASLEPFRSKLAVIGNGVDLQRFRPGIREGAFTILYAGRVDRRKRPGALALGRAVDRLPGDVRFWVAANRPLPSARAEYLGWQPDVHRFMGRAHVVVGTGLAIREGLACGAACLVLGQRYGGPVDPDAVGQEGFPDFSGLNPTAPEPDDEVLYRDLRGLYDDRSRLHRLMARGRRCAQRLFDLEIMVDATLRVYREAMEAWRGSAPRPGYGNRGSGAPGLPAGT